MMNGNPHVFVGAKSLGKSENLSQHITYCVTEGVPFFVTTDGVKWEIYDTCKRVALANMKVVEWDLLSMQEGEVARNALALWRSAPIGAAAPPSILGRTSPERPHQLPPGTPLTQITVSKGKAPAFSQLVFPDGSSYQIKVWRHLLVHTADWLLQTGKLSQANCPLSAGRKRNLVNDVPQHPGGRKFIDPVKVGQFWLESNYSARGAHRMAIRLLKQCGVNADTVIAQ
jgi:hypothetical protein